MANGWWNLDGTISTCVAAYQAIGAASYAASLVNLFNPGTYDLTTASGKDPSWNVSTGWTGNGTDQYLNTNVNASVNYSFIVRATGLNGSHLGYLLGCYRDGYGAACIWNNEANKINYGNAGAAYYTYAPGTLTGGVFAIGSNGTSYDSYYNGSVLDSDRAVTKTLAAIPYYIFARNANTYISHFSDATIQAVAIYNGDIASYIGDLTTAIAALSGGTSLTAKDFDLAAATFDAPTLNLVTSGLVAEYRFDDGSGTTVSEYINNYDATITSGTWVTEGLENGAISAAGVPDSVFLGADGFTMMVVANVDTNSPVPVFASKGGDDATETPIRWRGYPNSPILFTVRANTANRKSGTEISRKTAVMNKGWQVYSIVAPQAIESDIVQYVNTCKYLTPQFGTGTGAATGTESALSSSITGKFAYILIYNRQLTHEEIETNYAYLKATLATRSITLPAMGVGLAFNGDSLTSGTGASFDDDYPSQTMRLLGAGYDKWNWGIPGSSFPFYDAGVDASISGSRTDYYYIIWGGSNSIDGGATAVNTYNLLLADIAARKAAGYDKVYVLTAINRAQYSDDQRTQFLAYNELIKDAGNQATYDYTAVDIASDERLWDYTNTTYFSTDQVHLTDVGYGVVATFVYAAIMGYDMLATTGMSLLPFTFDAPTFDTYEYREILDKIVRMNLEVNASVVLNKEIDFTYSELEAI